MSREAPGVFEALGEALDPYLNEVLRIAERHPLASLLLGALIISGACCGGPTTKVTCECAPIAAPVPCSAPSRGPVGVLPEGS